MGANVAFSVLFTFQRLMLDKGMWPHATAAEYNLRATLLRTRIDYVFTHLDTVGGLVITLAPLDIYQRLHHPPFSRRSATRRRMRYPRISLITSSPDALPRDSLLSLSSKRTRICSFAQALENTRIGSRAEFP